MDLSIIIVSFNTKDLLKRCLASIESSTDSLKKEVIVVDNASTDGSAEMVTEAFPKVVLIKRSDNPGFGVANNVGASKATGAYLLFLNSDTTINPETLQILLDKAKKYEANIATGTLLNPNGTLQPQGGALPTLSNITAWMLFIDDLPLIGLLIKAYQQRHPSFFKKDRLMGWVGGTALLIKRGFFSSLHGFSPDIFMYGEDVDLCLRAYRAHKISPWYLTTPAITHVGQGSGNQEKSLVGECKGLLYLFSSYYPAWQLAWLKLVLKIGALARLLLFGIILRSENKKRAYQSVLAMV